MKTKMTLFASTFVWQSLPAAAQTQGPGWHMHDWGFGMGGGMFIGPLLTIGLIILLVVLIVPFVRSLGGNGPRAQSQSARDILDARYAKGEITREEYMRLRQDIGA